MCTTRTTNRSLAHDELKLISRNNRRMLTTSLVVNSETHVRSIIRFFGIKVRSIRTSGQNPLDIISISH
jgi:hypothetical protein